MLTVRAIESLIQAARSAGRQKTSFDGAGNGLYILAKPTGKAFWRLKFILDGREKLTSLGEYPEVSLKMARDRCHEARQKIADGINPVEVRRTERTSRANTFKILSEDWLKRQVNLLLTGTINRHRSRLETFVYPYIANKPMKQIVRQDLLAVLRRVEAQGKLDTAKRIRELCSQIWLYAIDEGKADFDIAHSLKGAIKTKAQKSHAAITDPRKLGGLLRAIDGYDGSVLTAGALKLAPMVFVRPGELRKMEWTELDLDAAIWTIPAAKMKVKHMRDPHIVPLSRQAVKVLESLKLHSESGKYVFPSLQTTDRPMSENTLNGALRRLGYSHEEHVAHGFRATARTLMGNLEYDSEAIELQLAHQRRGVNRAYNRATRMEYRINMMQKWSDYLDKLKTGVP